MTFTMWSNQNYGLEAGCLQPSPSMMIISHLKNFSNTSIPWLNDHISDYLIRILLTMEVTEGRVSLADLSATLVWETHIAHRTTCFSILLLPLICLSTHLLWRAWACVWKKYWLASRLISGFRLMWNRNWSNTVNMCDFVEQSLFTTSRTPKLCHNGRRQNRRVRGCAKMVQMWKIKRTWWLLISSDLCRKLIQPRRKSRARQGDKRTGTMEKKLKLDVHACAPLQHLQN